MKKIEWTQKVNEEGKEVNSERKGVNEEGEEEERRSGD